MEAGVLDIRTISDGALAKMVMAPRGQHDSAAEAELCRRFMPRVLLYGRKHLRDSHAAEDLVQNVMTLALQKLRAGEVRQPDQVGSFILGVARMKTKETYRDINVSDPIREDTLTDDGPTADVLGLSRLGECVERLPERERSILLLSYFEERTTAQIAALWATSPTHVRVIRHRAVERLRRSLKGEETEA